MSAIRIDDLADAIMDELYSYSDTVTEQLKADVKQVAKECVIELKNNSPDDTGDYKKGWKAKTAYESKTDIRVNVYNAKKPQLTHLLENGHAKVGGGRVEGKPHILLAEQSAEKKLLKKVKVSVSGNNS